MRSRFGWLAAVAMLAGCAKGPAQVPLLQTPGSLPAEAMARARQSQSVFQPVLGQPITWNNKLAVYPDRAALPVVQELLESAKQTIFFETFELHEDASGKGLIDLLIAKHKAGLQVRVILDEIGNRSVKSTSVKTLQKAGIPVVFYGPYPFYNKTGTGLNITHRKLYLVDGDKAMTGGMNLGDKYFEHAHDMLWRVEGDAAFALHREFAAEWRRVAGKANRDNLVMPVQPTGTYGSEPISIAVTSPREQGREHEIRQVLFRGIDSAKTRIDMAYPFFWDDKLLDKLVKAEKRGVQVRVVLTTHGKASMTKLNTYSARQTLSKGIEYHWYEKSYAHIKYCAIDDAFLAIGSSNGDTLTFENNQELDLILTNPATVAGFRAQVSDADWADTRAVSEKDIAVGPVGRPLLGLLELIDGYL